MNNKYFNIGVRIVILFLLVFLLDAGAGKIFGFYYPKMKAGQASRITYAIDKSDEDILIFGSSKANHHYVPDVFEQKLKASCYNAGIDGQSILYHYAVLHNILKRYTPKYIILDLHVDEFNDYEISYTSLSVLLPYYNSHPSVREIVNLRGPYEKYKTVSNLYLYNSLSSTIFKNNFITKKDEIIKGYYPLSRVMKKPLEKDIDRTTDIDTAKVEYFKKFVNEARAAGSEVFVFVSPVFRIRENGSQTVNIAKAFCEQQNILLQDFSQSPVFLKSEYFDDASHLNDGGAVIYSRKICDEIINAKSK